MTRSKSTKARGRRPAAAIGIVRSCEPTKPAPAATVLIRGESGIGKSECVLELIERGYSLVSDDITRVVLMDGKDVVGTSDEMTRNMMEVRARKGRIIAVATEGDTDVQAKADHVLYVPATIPMLQPILSVVPLQLLAYHCAILKGTDVDQPRNLAKSVTVE